MNATLSRWFLSMLACTLKMKPDTLSSLGDTVRGSAGLGRGDGALPTMKSSSCETEKPFSALPKMTGVRWPSR